MADRPAENTRVIPPARPTPAPRAASGAAGSSGAGEAAKPSLVERIQSRLSTAAQEHQANAKPTPTPPPAAPRPAGGRQPRRARLRLTRIDPWSVMKTAFMLSIVFGIVTVVSVLMVWSLLGAAGVWDSINASISSVLSSDGQSTFDIEDYVGTSRIVGFTVLVAAFDVLVLTALATLAAFVYNMAAALLGGIEVTLAEDDH